MTTDVESRADVAAQEARLGLADATKVFVAATVNRLQSGYVRAEPTSASRAALARLRRGVGKSPGACPDLAEFYVNPALDAWGEAPTRAEWAAHMALGLYALHQQSGHRRMHRPKTSFGTAVGVLRGGGDQENPGVVRRFQALGTSSDLTELAQHARGLVQLLRQHDPAIGFDYGDFAADLVRFQNPNTTDGVRLKWGRGFYRVRPVDSDENPAAADADSAAPSAAADSQ